MHIYAFGSICRGEVTPESDVDLLAITDGFDARFKIETYSVYSYARMRQIWDEGNPFAWHLFIESRMIFADDNRDFLRELNAPQPYRSGAEDCEKFYCLFSDAWDAVRRGTNSPVFELSTVYLAVRNFATCYSLGFGELPVFTRHSALHLGSSSLGIDGAAFSALERARILSTRGVGKDLAAKEMDSALKSFEKIDQWMSALLRRVRRNERVQ